MNGTKVDEVKTIGEQYGELWGKLQLLPLRWISSWLNGDDTNKSPFTIKIFYMLVIGLALASVVNVGQRAYFYHPNIFSYITGACLALVVPASVFVAAHTKGLGFWGRVYVWAVAMLAALLSSFIQIKMYMVDSHLTFAMLLDGNLDPEALSFSAGIPFFEILIASLSALLSNIHEAKIETEKKAKEAAAIKLQEEEKAKADAAKATAIAEAIRLREEEDARLDREHQRSIIQRRQEFELQMLQEEGKTKLDIQREKAIAEIEIKKQRAVKPIQKSATGSATEPATSRSNQSASHSIGYDEQMKMLTIYQSEPMLSDEKMGERIGISKKSVQDLLADLKTREVVDVKKIGRGKSVTVNGGFPAFQAGESA